MLKKTITYTDFNDVTRTEDFFFNISKAEAMELEMTRAGGYSAFLERIVNAQDNKQIVEVFKSFILTAYGEKSPDGKRFIKSKELSEAFSQTDAYTQLFMELATDGKAAAVFFAEALPKHK